MFKSIKKFIVSWYLFFTCDHDWQPLYHSYHCHKCDNTVDD